jgi:hypothetical protein
MEDGYSPGVMDSMEDGNSLGTMDGKEDGFSLGSRDGMEDGFSLGTMEGMEEGFSLGAADGMEGLYITLGLLFSLGTVDDIIDMLVHAISLLIVPRLFVTGLLMV